jgi:hypothetical protein
MDGTASILLSCQGRATAASYSLKDDVKNPALSPGFLRSATIDFNCAWTVP